MDYFFSETVNENDKRNVAFQTVVGIRDAISIAKRTEQPITYEQALRTVFDFDESLYEQFTSLLTEKNENDLAKSYKEEARIRSRQMNSLIKPENLIAEEIKKYQQLIQQGKDNNEDVTYSRNRFLQLCAALESLKPRRVSEHAVLNRDFNHSSRKELYNKVLEQNYHSIDYLISRNRFLRLRLLHPDKAEHVTGADLLYEQYNMETYKVRFVFLQYKMWENGMIYFSRSGNLVEQIQKMKKCLCDYNYCERSADTASPMYRFPYCAGFLRPTDKLQHEKSKMVSSGLHLPICDVIRLSSSQPKIEKKSIKHYTLNHKIFERLFNLNLIGSRWIDIAELERHYQNHNILESSENVKLYATEFLNPC